MNLTSKYFYKSHKQEILKYIKSDSNYANIVNFNSNIPDQMFNNIVKLQEEETVNEALNRKSDGNKFDLIVLTDIFELSDDIYNTLKNIKNHLKDDGYLILSSINPPWHFLIKLIEKLGIKDKTDVKSYIKPEKIEAILKASNFQRIKKYNRLYIPFRLFGLGSLINFICYLFLPFINLGMRNYLIYSKLSETKNTLTKSIIIPAKNEEGNLDEVIRRVPSFNEDYELIIVCGESRDNTYEKSIQIKEQLSSLNIKVIKQSKNGKANAVWEGVDVSSNDLIAILDSDLSVDPETLTDFFEIIEYGNADFVNGTRLIYQMEKGSMQSLNKIGNRVFQFLISKLISVQLSDSLCGTKVFKKSNIEFITKWQKSMYVSDPFCDFDLIFSSAYSAQRIVELPVHYRTRKYGSTNISRFKDGWRLFFYFINSYLLFKTDLYTIKSKT